MKAVWLTLPSILLLVGSGLATPPSTPTGYFGEAAQHFKSGRRLVAEENCGDCMGATKEGLQRGIDELLAAQRAGYPDEAAIYRNLAEAYRDMAFLYLRNETAAQQELLNKARDAYRRVTELQPENAQALLEYVGFAKLDRTKSIVLYRRVLSLSPRQWDAHAGLGWLLIEDGQVREGISEVKAAMLGNDNAKDIENYVVWTRDAATKQKCEVGFPGAEDQLPPWGDAGAFAAYRQKCIAVLESIRCKNTEPKDR